MFLATERIEGSVQLALFDSLLVVRKDGLSTIFRTVDLSTNPPTSCFLRWRSGKYVPVVPPEGLEPPTPAFVARYSKSS